MPTIGPVRAATYASVATPGSLPWAAPDNAALLDGDYAFVDFTTVVVDETTEPLRATNVPFMLAPDAMSIGLDVAVVRSQVGNGVHDLSVRLVHGGAAIGPDKAAVGEWPTVDTVAVYSWDVAALAASGVTPAVVNHPTFGVQIVATEATGTGPRARVDDIAFTLTYVSAAAIAAPSLLRKLGRYTLDRIAYAFRAGRRGLGAQRIPS